MRKKIINIVSFAAGAILVNFLLNGGGTNNDEVKILKSNFIQPSVEEQSRSLADLKAMGIGRAFLTKSLPKASFTRGTDIDGLENYIFRDGGRLYQIIGPADSIRQASYTVSYRYGDSAAIDSANAALREFAVVTQRASVDWVTQSLSTLFMAPERKMEQSAEGIKAKLDMLDLDGSGCIVILSYQAE
jgi:hypothetical protein